MNKIFMLAISFLCISKASSGPYNQKSMFPRRCNHCQVNAPCINEINSCLAGPKHSCKTVKIHNFRSNNYTTILTCSKTCKPVSKIFNDLEIEVSCCNNEDYCNVD